MAKIRNLPHLHAQAQLLFVKALKSLIAFGHVGLQNWYKVQDLREQNFQLVGMFLRSEDYFTQAWLRY